MNTKHKQPRQPFLADIEAIRDRARRHMEQGAITEGYKGDRTVVIRLLNEVLATEIVCALRYRRHYYMARGIHSESIAEEFLEHAAEEQQHADLVAGRITQLGGAPDLNPSNLASRAHSEYVEGESLLAMIREDLVAERIAIESYSEIIRYLGDNDPTSRVLMEKVLATEEEHAEDMRKLLDKLSERERTEKILDSPSRDLVDEAAQESFPASDPPSWTTGSEPRRKRAS